MDNSHTSKRPLPSAWDWLILAIDLVFVVMAVILLPTAPEIGLVTLAFFGTGLVLAAATVWRKLRYRRFTARAVSVAGGVPIPRDRRLFGLLGAWLVVLGLVMALVGQSYPLVFRGIGGLIAVVGAGLLLATLSGFWPRGYLEFTPEGFTFAERTWRVLVPWEEIAFVHEAELQGNPVLLIGVGDLARVAIAPSEREAQARRWFARISALWGAEIAIMTTHYRIDLPVLAGAVERYARDAAARAELRPRVGEG